MALQAAGRDRGLHDICKIQIRLVLWIRLRTWAIRRTRFIDVVIAARQDEADGYRQEIFGIHDALLSKRTRRSKVKLHHSAKDSRKVRLRNLLWYVMIWHKLLIIRDYSEIIQRIMRE